MTVVVTDVSALPGEAAGGAGVRRTAVGERTSTADRQARALAALAAAEQRTGVRRPRTQVAAAAVGPATATSHPYDGADSPRSTTGVVSGALGERRPTAAGPSLLDLDPHARRLPVQPALAGLLPGGGLPVGGTITVQGSTSLLHGLLAAASQDGAWVVFVGAPAVGLVAAADAGLVLDRVAVVPAPGADAPTVVAALLDGVDVVVLGPAVALLDADRPRLAARARERGAVLVATTAWPGAHVALQTRGGAWWGADQGAGWLRRRTLRVRRTGRGAAARPLDLEVEVPVAPTTRDRIPVADRVTAADHAPAGLVEATPQAAGPMASGSAPANGLRVVA